jgi:thymidylate synthase
MRVIEARNVQEALPKAVWLMKQHGQPRQSRNGPVLVAPWPVTTVYERPCERMIFWPQRDANPSFHVFESLWMLAGRNDLKPLLRYVKDFGRFSDNGKTLYGAYGYRWRMSYDIDQLQVIAERLIRDPDDRRSVLQIWQTEYDLDRVSKDVPCNLMATFQVNNDGALDLTVFCRSNDMVWGAYGANAVHFSVLLEYMAIWIGRPVGYYRQISVNWHAYDSEPWRKVEGLPAIAFPSNQIVNELADPYSNGGIRAVPLIHGTGPEAIAKFDRYMEELLMHADTGFSLPRLHNDDEPWFDAAYAVLLAHHYWRNLDAPERFEAALGELERTDPTVDMVAAMSDWVARRHDVWRAKQIAEAI